MKAPHILCCITLGILLAAVSVLPYITDAQLRSRKAGQDQGFDIATEQTRKEAISHHYARFDMETGKWRWNTADESLNELNKMGADMPTLPSEISLNSTELFPVVPPSPKKVASKTKK